MYYITYWVSTVRFHTGKRWLSLSDLMLNPFWGKKKKKEKEKMRQFKFIETFIWVATPENVPSHMCAQRRLRSACTFAQSDQNLLGLLWIAKDEKLHADNEDSDLTARMRRLIWVFVGSTCQKVLFFLDYGPFNSVYHLFPAVSINTILTILYHFVKDGHNESYVEWNLLYFLYKF